MFEFLSPSRLSFACAVALVTGVCLALCGSALLPASYALGGALLFGAWWLLTARWRFVAAVGLGFALGQWHAGEVVRATVPLALDRETATLVAEIEELPIIDEGGLRFVATVERAPKSFEFLVKQQIRVQWYAKPGEDVAPYAERFRVGQTWELPLQMRMPRSVINEGGFDSEKSAFAKRIVGTGRLKDLDDAVLLRSKESMFSWRQQSSARIGSSVTSPSSRFVRALALGDTRGISQDDWQILRNDGLTHLIAISGSHVGFVAVFFALFGKLLVLGWPRLTHLIPMHGLMAVLGVVGGVGYAILTGSEVPTVRTAMMLVVIAISILARRSVSAFDTLGAVAFVMVAWDPMAVMTAGFWLSFLGVGWLMAVMPPLGAVGGMKLFLQTQWVATLGLMPLGVLLFGQVSAAGSLANLLAVPWWSCVVVPLSLLGTGVDAVWSGGGVWIWNLAAWCFDLTWPLFVWLSKQSGAMFFLPTLMTVGLVMGLLAALVLTLPSRTPGRWLGVVLTLPMLWPYLPRPSQGDVSMRVIDVGQGLSVFMQTASHNFLYDVGPAKTPGRDEGELSVLPTLRAMGVSTVDLLMLSHGDKDHAGGFEAVKRGVHVIDAQAPLGSGVRDVALCHRGQEWIWDGVKFEVLWPLPDTPYLANDSSCVVKVTARNATVLLTGDIGVDPERELIAMDGEKLKSDVVTVPHHGSESSSSEEFIAAVKPKLALAGTGFKNQFRHPRPVIVKRWLEGGAVFDETAKEGAMRVVLNGSKSLQSGLRDERQTLWDAENPRK